MKITINTMFFKKLLAIIARPIFWIGLWQLDLQCFPGIWANGGDAEILPFWHMPKTYAYVMFYGWIFFGYALLELSYVILPWHVRRKERKAKEAQRQAFPLIQ